MKTNSNLSITVLMTVYNGGAYLEQAIESVLRQSYDQFELLIIDDRSTDNSVQIVQSFQDKRIVLHCNDSNIGQTKSLNVGLKLSRGQYIARIDADDRALKNWLKDHVDFLMKINYPIVVTTDAVVIDDLNRVQRFLKSPRHPEEMILKSLIASPLNHGGCLMNRECILFEGGYSEQYRIAADYDLWSRLIRKGYQLHHNGCVGMAIRFHQASLSLSEKKTTTLPEAAMIMHSNVVEWTDKSLAQEELYLLWCLSYEPETLLSDEFKLADKIFEFICGSIKKNMVSFKLINNFLKQQRKTFFIKRIFGLIRKKDSAAVKETLTKTIQKKDRCFLIKLIHATSCLNFHLVSLWPRIYSFVTMIQAKILVGDRVV